jgi:hypothetical protein
MQRQKFCKNMALLWVRSHLTTILFLDVKIAAGRFMRESIISLYWTVYSGIDCAQRPHTSLTVTDAIVSLIYVCLALPYTGTQCAIQVRGLKIFIFLYILFY